LEYLKPLLEAFLLSELDDASIAAELHLSAATVHWYLLAFFDFERFRNTALLILHRVIGVVDEAGKVMLNVHKLWKIVAYFWKSPALKKLLSLSTPTSASKTDWPNWLASQMLTSVKLKQVLAVNGLNAEDPKQNAVLLNLAAQECGARQEDAKGSSVPA
jgi:hypothetical protein